MSLHGKINLHKKKFYREMLLGTNKRAMSSFNCVTAKRELEENSFQPMKALAVALRLTYSGFHGAKDTL